MFGNFIIRISYLYALPIKPQPKKEVELSSIATTSSIYQKEKFDRLNLLLDHIKIISSTITILGSILCLEHIWSKMGSYWKVPPTILKIPQKPLLLKKCGSALHSTNMNFQDTVQILSAKEYTEWEIMIVLSWI